MRFAKYHGIGNDFVLFADPDDGLSLDAALVATLCDRRFGIGGDGVIRVAPGREGGDFFMDYVNSDGSIGEMCGNGIRCMAVFARAEGLTTATELKVETRAGLKVVSILDDGRVRVDMGPPAFPPPGISTTSMHGLAETLNVDGESVEFALVSMGNPHAVIFRDELGSAPVTTLGPAIEHHSYFPEGTNVEWARVEGPDRVVMRVWERGSGETLACGTGACAVGVVARLLKGVGERSTIVLPGGELEVEWAGSLEDERPVYLTGPVAKSFEGDVDLDAHR